MANYRYRAMTPKGEVVSGSIAAPSAAEVARRIEYLGLVPIETVSEGSSTSPGSGEGFSWASLTINQPKAEDVTLFSRDLAILLKAGARLDDALELILADDGFVRLRGAVRSVRGAILAGETFADALAKHPKLFSSMYISMVRVGEASGTLEHVIEALADERVRTEQLRRRVSDALRYPAFVLFAAGSVMIFFLSFVLPQFASILRDFGAKLDPLVAMFLAISDFLRGNATILICSAAFLVVAGWLILRNQSYRERISSFVLTLPVVRGFGTTYRTALFCRNLGVLLGNGVPLTMALKMLIDMVSIKGREGVWSKAAERVRQGGRLSDALTETQELPVVAVRMLRLGEETGQMAPLAIKVAELFEAKLARSLDRFVGIVGPAAIILISLIVGGLIVSVMTSLLSINQLVGQ